MKNGNGTWKWAIGIIAVFIPIAIGAAVAYGVMKGSLTKDIERTHEEVDEVKADVKVMEPKIQKNAARIDVVDRDIDWIREDIKDIKTDNAAIKKGVDTIIEKMDEK